jgi:hypothetical protein
MFKKESFDYCLLKINEVIDHNAGFLKKCFKPELWKRDLLINLFGKEFKAPEEVNNTENFAIEKLFKNIYSKVVLDELKAI